MKIPQETDGESVEEEIVFQFYKSGKDKYSMAFNEPFTPVGMAGTNSGVLEISSIPPLNLEKRLKYLIKYPHGCVEQTTSGAFPQLYLDKLVELSSQQKSDITRNIKAAIKRLISSSYLQSAWARTVFWNLFFRALAIK